jgi:hypothetical protein
LLSCLYHDSEFVRVGYYVNNEYIDEELRENPPENVIIEKLQRNILSDKPKVTRYTIDWSNPQNEVSQQQQPTADQVGLDNKEEVGRKKKKGEMVLIRVYMLTRGIS